MNRTTITIAALLGLTALTGCNVVPETLQYLDSVEVNPEPAGGTVAPVTAIDAPIEVDCLPPAGSTDRPSAGATHECPNDQPASTPIDPCVDKDGRAGCLNP